MVVFREWRAFLCPRCEGTFYGETVLASLLEQPDLRVSYFRPALLGNLDAPFPPEVAQAPIECPTCCKTLVLEAYSSEIPHRIQRCPDGHGIWLNDGELGGLSDDREKLHPWQDPGFFEGLRRLAGLRPRVKIGRLTLQGQAHQPLTP